MRAALRRGILAVALAFAVAAPPPADARAGHGPGIGHAVGRPAHHAHKKNCQNDSCLASHPVGTPKSQSVAQ